MDIITQAALGGAIAQGGFKSHQRRGVAFGAFCGIVPDLDGLLSIGDRWQGLVTHRGSSHSLLVLPLLAIPLGW
ncbi:MAG: hydrolase, partial [Myxococcales bacterium]|nr:hydrolase [Myxococcales bacterium]